MFKPFVALTVLLAAIPAYAQAPGPPTGLVHTVNGTTVVLTWSAPVSGGPPSSYLVEAAFTPGGGIIASLPVTGNTLTVPGVPSGVYYVRVRALNGSGPGPASNEVTVSVSGGCPAPPQAPSLIVRSVAFQATVTWGSSGGCAPTNYTLFAGTAPGLSNVTIVNAGAQLGLSAIAPAGTYYVRVVGSNAFGSATSQELVVRVAANAQTDTVTPNGAVAFDVQATQTGTYNAMLLWDDPTLDLDLYLTTPGCPYPPTGCLLAISDGTGTNTERVSRPFNAGATFRLWVDNFSLRTTSFTIFSTVGAAVQGSARGASTTDDSGAVVEISKIKP